MKKLLLIVGVLCLHVQVFAQAQELEQLALDIEKLSQFKTILKNMKQGYEIVSGGYTTVKDLTQGNFNLHKTFLDGLLTVSPTVRQYKKITVIISCQGQIVKEYKSALAKFSASPLFHANELSYLSAVYNNLLTESARNMEDLLNVVTDGVLRASDDERLRQIDQIADHMQTELSFLRSFNGDALTLLLQRAKQQGDVQTIRQYYDIKN